MNKEHASIYYFDDKDVFDGLMAEKSLTSGRLLDFLRNRGVFWGYSNDKALLCNYIASWFNDYSTLDELSLGIRTKKSRTRYTNEEMELPSSPAGFTAEQFEGSIEELKKSVVQDGGALIVEKDCVTSDYDLTWLREEVDWSKTTLCQTVKRTDKINIRLGGDGTILMRTSLDGSNATLRDKFHAILEGAAKSPVSRFAIHLPQDASCQERITFFMDILCHTPGLRMENVTKLSLQPEGEEELEDDIEDALGDQDALAFNKVLSARLQGGNLLETQEYQYLVERKFSPNEMRWWATLGSGDMVFAVAGFSNQGDTNEFFCNFPAIRKKSKKKNELKKTLESVPPDLHRQLMNALENKAKEACKKLLEARATI